MIRKNIILLLLCVISTLIVSCGDEDVNKAPSNLFVESDPTQIFMFFSFVDDDGDDLLQSIEFDSSTSGSYLSSPDFGIYVEDIVFEDSTRQFEQVMIAIGESGSPILVGLTAFHAFDTYYVRIGDDVDTLTVTNGYLYYENIEDPSTGVPGISEIFFNGELVTTVDFSTMEEETRSRLHENHRHYCCFPTTNQLDLSDKDLFVVNLK